MNKQPNCTNISPLHGYFISKLLHNGITVGCKDKGFTFDINELSKHIVLLNITLPSLWTQPSDGQSVLLLNQALGQDIIYTLSLSKFWTMNLMYINILSYHKLCPWHLGYPSTLENHITSQDLFQCSSLCHESKASICKTGVSWRNRPNNMIEIQQKYKYVGMAIGPMVGEHMLKYLKSNDNSSCMRNSSEGPQT